MNVSAKVSIDWLNQARISKLKSQESCKQLLDFELNLSNLPLMYWSISSSNTFLRDLDTFLNYDLVVIVSKYLKVKLLLIKVYCKALECQVCALTFILMGWGIINPTMELHYCFHNESSKRGYCKGWGRGWDVMPRKQKWQFFPSMQI